jgi:hypothetical protein
MLPATHMNIFGMYDTDQFKSALRHSYLRDYKHQEIEKVLAIRLTRQLR